MVKLIGALAILAGAGGMGAVLGNEAKEEIHHLEEINRMISFLSGEIGCCNGTLQESAWNAAERLKTPYSTFLTALGDAIHEKSGEGLPVLWKKLSLQVFQGCIWKAAEQREFERLGEHLGYLNQSMQLTILEQYQDGLTEKITDRKKKLNEKVKLYNCLGIAGGLFLIILLL